nr:hypothetical protein [Klebsiella quasipneumoniae]
MIKSIFPKKGLPVCGESFSVLNDEHVKAKQLLSVQPCLVKRLPFTFCAPAFNSAYGFVE